MDRGLRYRWRFRTSGPRQDAPTPGVPAVVSRLLAARELTDPDAIAAFANPTLHQLHPANLLPNIDRAAGRILESLDRGGPLVIYGDYDVDGITATAILYHLFACIAPDAEIRTYVPHRMSEGYGLNAEALEQIHSEGADLVVSVDCGITAHEPAAAAKRLGLDLIITDHHNPPAPGQPLPDAVAVVHPRLPGSAYPYGELCGAGVAFKLAWRVATMWCNSDRVTKPLQKCLLESLAFAALGTIADVVPLVDENRIIARYGLQNMRATSFGGLNALVRAAGLADEARIDAEAVGFRLAPRLNACGRMGHARDAVRLFTTATDGECTQIAEALNKVNEERQTTERSIFDQAQQLAHEAEMIGEDRRIIILAHEDWHPGVVGIVCSRLVDRFGRPAILMQRHEEMCKGSARSIDGYSIHEGLEAVREHLHTFGGHDMAAGLAVRCDRFDAFVEALTEHANERISVDQLTPELLIDCSVDIDELTPAAVIGLQKLGPFGRANPAPSVMIGNARLVEPPRAMGAEGKHLALKVKQRDSQHLRLVWWRMGRLADQLTEGMELNLVVKPTLNTWRGVTKVEAEIRDLAKADAY